MKTFAFASCLGDVSVLLGMLVVLVYGLLYQSENVGKDCIAVGSINTMPLAIGAIGYLFLIHFLSLPIESSMAQPERFQSVAQKTFGACGVVSGIFGVIGYLLFGNETQQIVLLNVQGSIFVSAVKLLLCIDLLLTYPVVMRPSIVIVEQSLSTIVGSPKATTSKTSALSVPWSVHIATCALLGICAAMASIFVPAFGLLSGLVGGVSQTFLALVLPPLMFARQHHLSTNGVDFVKRMDKGGKLLVVSGVVLILWTGVSTWNELS
jgi:proton-coupled amino acid transporter